MFSLGNKIEIVWGDTRLTSSSGTVQKVTPKFVYLNQGAIRGQWVPRHLIRQINGGGQSVGDINGYRYM